ncbi:glycosyltransferase [Culicoidibacter larvae]|uniref:Erythromycin biosynthesis protein CIII-like C-terminal domain-containing protein n=1 Tax=Culicoidibacter larvae TaxID=2579976 RepID=A0A5R8QHT9_9FIRM|nr:nucleotide disphospho-sugar-binding domain-containing protein [Culicoidibacter larvae]TLG77250.1 hypothetical protein FEZ08_01140 [Culicoidibacter larvae]
MIRIDFIAPPLSGHLFPMLYLAKQLQKYAPGLYDIRFISGEGKRSVIEAEGFTMHALMPDDPFIFERLARAQGRTSMFHQAFRLSKKIGEMTEEIKAVISERDTQLVVNDFITYPGVFAAEQLQLPWITCIPTPFAIENIDGTPAFLGGLQPPKSFLGRGRDAAGRLLVRKVKQTLIFALRKQLGKYLPSLYREDGSEAIYSATAIIAMGYEGLQFERTWPSQLQFAGYGAVNEEIELEIPFARFQYCILVTTGTMLPLAQQKIDRLIEQLAQQLPDTLFVVSGGDAKASTYQQRENILRVAFVPYNQYLADFDMVIHHGGAGIVNLCIEHGKPAIVIPQDYDQFDFAARIQYFEIGIWVKKPAVQSLCQAIERIRKQPAWPQLEQLQVEVQQMNAGKIIHEVIQREWKRGEQQ